MRFGLCVAIIFSSTLLFAQGTAWSDGLTRNNSVPVQIENRSRTDFRAETEPVVLKIKDLLPPHLYSSVRKNSFAVVFAGNEIPSQYDDMNNSGSVDGEDELSFLIPVGLKRGKRADFRIGFSTRGNFPEKEVVPAWNVRKIGNFTRASNNRFTVYFNHDSGGINGLKLKTDPEITLAKATMYSPIFSFIGKFHSPEQNKSVWQDRLASWMFHGEALPPLNGPVRSVIRFRRNAYHGKATLKFDDTYDTEYCLYPDGRIIGRLTINRNRNKADASYCMVFVNLPLALEQPNPVEAEVESFPFTSIRAGNQEGNELENVPIVPGKKFSYQRPESSVLSFLEARYDGNQLKYGLALIIDPYSRSFREGTEIRGGSRFDWGGNPKYRGGQRAVQLDPWSGREFNMEMCSREWPRPNSKDPALTWEFCFLPWEQDDSVEYVAKALQGGSLCRSSIHIGKVTKVSK